MRIGIDANAMYKNRAGTGVYVRNLFEAMQEFDASNIYMFFAHNSRVTPLDTGKHGLAKRMLNGVKDIIWTQAVLPIHLLRSKIDVFHAPALIAPTLTHCPSIVTVLDLSFVRYPDTCDGLWRLYALFSLHIALKRATIIIAISESVRQELVKMMGISESRIKVVYPGVNHKFHAVDSTSSLAEIKDKYGTSDRFILNVGTLEPRKNVPRLIQAYGLLRDQEAIEHKLVIVGSVGWRYHGIYRAVTDLGLNDEVVFTGYVDDNELRMLYSAADLLVYPSLYEGFGLPPLEAMACGCPVITSNVSSLPEVVGDVGVLVNPHSVDELASAIYSVLNDEVLRRQMADKGLQRSTVFSWSKAAEATLHIYYQTIDKEISNDT